MLPSDITIWFADSRTRSSRYLGGSISMLVLKCMKTAFNGPPRPRI